MLGTFGHNKKNVENRVAEANVYNIDGRKKKKFL